MNHLHLVFRGNCIRNWNGMEKKKKKERKSSPTDLYIPNKCAFASIAVTYHCHTGTDSCKINWIPCTRIDLHISFRIVVISWFFLTISTIRVFAKSQTSGSTVLPLTQHREKFHQPSESQVWKIGTQSESDGIWPLSTIGGICVCRIPD